MSRSAKPWFWKVRKTWCVTIEGTRHNLGAEKREAFQRFHELMVEPPPKPVLVDDSIHAIFEQFLEWVQKNRSPATCDWYRERLNWFAKTISASMRVSHLKPFHVQQWVDSHEKWSSTHKGGCIQSVKRAMNWAEKIGHISHSPIKHMEKPAPGRREFVIKPELYKRILVASRDQEFKDLVVTAWETGARPQEILRVEARHVDLVNSRWVIPPREAKIKTRVRLVYLSDAVLEITKRMIAQNPEGPLFRNRFGKPWTPFATKCRFGRLVEKIKLDTTICMREADVQTRSEQN